MIKRTIQFSVFSFILTITATAQDTVWISNTGHIVFSKDSATSYNLIYKSKTDSQRVRVLSYSMRDTILSERNYYPFKLRGKKVLNGIYRSFINGKLYTECIYTDGKINGYYKSFWDNGELRRDEIYEEDNFVTGKCYTQDGKDTICFAHEIQASFPGGTDSLRRWITRNFHYPDSAYDEGIQGTVQVAITLSIIGDVEDAKIWKSVCPALDKEAIRLVKRMPAWTPAKQEGKAVKSFFILPIAFVILDE